jgi:hypothetical protein
LDGELEQLPDGKSYESEDDEDAPGQVVEDEDLLGVGKAQPRTDPDAAARPSQSPTRRSEMAATGADHAEKKLSAAQQRFQAEQAQWSPLKTDGTETRRYDRPEFMPFKEGSQPEGFAAKPEHEAGGPSPDVRKVLKASTPPYIYVAEIGGFDAKLFTQFRAGSNSCAADKSAGADDHWPQFKPFSVEEMVKGCGLLLRNGVAPAPRQSLLFSDPRESFVFGDARVRAIWTGKDCGGGERRWVQFRSFFVLSYPGCQPHPLEKDRPQDRRIYQAVLREPTSTPQV